MKRFHVRRVGLKSDGTTGQTTGHLAARRSASRYMARRKATRQATELTTVGLLHVVRLPYIFSGGQTLRVNARSHWAQFNIVLRFIFVYAYFLLVHGQVTIIFVVSVCLSVCLCRVFLSRL